MTILPSHDDDPTRIGNYEIEGRLATGHPGTVFLGRSRDGLPATITQLYDDDPAAARLSFHERIDAARQVADAWGITILGADVDAGPPWIASTFLDGPTLIDVVQDDGALTVRAVRELAATIAERLSAVHARGFAHDRLAPSDIVLTTDGPRLADLALAREQGPVTPASDVRALGALLLFVCTARGESDDDMPGSGDEAGRPDLSDVPDELISLITACLNPDPTMRPTTEEIIARTGDDIPRTTVLPGTDLTVPRPMTLTAAVAWMLGGAVACLALVGGIVAAVGLTDRPTVQALAPSTADASPSAEAAHEVIFELEAAGPDVGKAPVTVRYDGRLGSDAVSNMDLGSLGNLDEADEEDLADKIAEPVELPWSKTFTLHGSIDGTDRAGATPALQVSAMLAPYDEATGTYLPSDVTLTCRILIDGEVVTEQRGRTTGADCRFYDNTEQQARYEAQQDRANADSKKFDELMDEIEQSDDPEDLKRLSELLRDAQGEEGLPGDGATPPAGS